MKPFKEVIIYDDVTFTSSGGNPNKLFFIDSTSSKIKLKQSGIQVIWSGSIDKFKKDFEIPNDAPLSSKETNLVDGDNATFVTLWDWTTLDFKFNYHVWYKDGDTNGHYVLGSNNSIDLTIPNVLVFDGNKSNNNSIKYYSVNDSLNRVYNPNLFPLQISITSFPTSNRSDNFQNVATNSGTDSLVYLVFRYGVNGHDIEICLLTKDSNNFQINNKPLYIPYASLTFTGFNKIKRLT